MNINAIIISLKYHPGHYSHIKAFFALFHDIGVSCQLVVNNNYRKLDSTISNSSLNELLIRRDKKFDYALFLFPHIRNIFEILKIKLFSKSKIIYVFHEPISSYNEFYKSGFSFWGIIKLFVINLVNVITVVLSYKIILPSSKALKIYKEKYKFWNKNFISLPLLFEDENMYSSSNTDSKKYISYIGTIACDHAFDKFCSFIENTLNNGGLDDLIFLIATGSNLPYNIKSKFERYQSSHRLVIVEGSWLSIEDINKYFNESLVVWNAYDRSTQSGVLPKAFMFNTPVLGNAQISNEYIIQDYNGIYLKDNTDFAEISCAVRKISENRDFFCENSRNTFLSIFFYKKYINEFSNILKL